MTTDQNGITVHSGESLSRINATLKGAKDRGIQLDHGFDFIDWRGGKIWLCGNDGGGGATGRWFFAGTKFEDNGKENHDSGDNLQISCPLEFEIVGCEFLEAPNANLILCELTVPGIIRRNRFIKARHGLAIQFKHVWPKFALFEFANSIKGNEFTDCESAFYLYGVEQKGEGIEYFKGKALDNNTFKNCQHKITTEWT